MALSAAQLIYTNVERKLSASGRDGYQIWLKTPNVLDEREETEIQSRLSDYEERKDATIAKDDAPVRHMYFPLSSGRVVLARTVPLAQTDEFKRGGRFYAHALILDADVFRRFDNDPFAILDQFEFQGSLDDGKRAGDLAKGAIAEASLDGKPRPQAAATVPTEKLPSLLIALLRACQGEKPMILGMPASPRQVLGIVRQLLAWLPKSLRARCSFDTLSTGKSLTQLPFSVVGLPVALTRRYPNLLLFDVAKLAFAAPAPPPAASVFDHWFAAQLTNAENMIEPIRNEAAYQLATALEGGGIEPHSLDEVDDKLFEAIVCSDLGVPKLERLLWPRLHADVGETLAPLIYSHALAWLRGGGLPAFKQLGEPIDSGRLVRWMLAAYEIRQKHEVHPETEAPALKEFLERTKNVETDSVNVRKRLVLVYYRWAGRWSNLAKSVCDPRMIPDDMYQWFVEWSLRSMPLLVEMACGPTARGVWCGPSVAALDEAEDAQCQNLLGALLGQAKLAEGEAESDAPQAALPPERWAWVLHCLLQLSPATAALEAQPVT